MEPKSIAFYTAVAVSILAVLSATTFPTLAQAQTSAATDEGATETEQNQEQSDQGNNNNDSTDNAPEEETEATENGEEDDATNGNRAASESLGLSSDNGQVTCGETINEPNAEVGLSGDLNCGPGDGLTVNAPGVHIKMNGYKITGDADEESSTQGLAMDYDGSTGILVNADGVIISGLGEVSGFDRGITFLGSSDGQLSDVQVANNGIGVLVSGSTGTELSRDTITNNDVAVILDSSSGGAIAFNQIVSNMENGIALLGADQNVVAANNMFGNGQYGIYMDITSNENTADYNTVFGHESADINNADGQPTNVNQNSFGSNNNCGTSIPGGLCR
jgi:parallel beta-helix repeat protein